MSAAATNAFTVIRLGQSGYLKGDPIVAVVSVLVVLVLVGGLIALIVWFEKRKRGGQ